MIKRWQERSTKDAALTLEQWKARQAKEAWSIPGDSSMHAQQHATSAEKPWWCLVCGRVYSAAPYAPCSGKP